MMFFGPSNAFMRHFINPTSILASEYLPKLHQLPNSWDARKAVDQLEVYLANVTQNVTQATKKALTGES